MQLSDCRILVSLPAYGGQITSLLNNSWTKLLRWAGDNDVLLSLQTISNESLLPRARNQGVAKLLEAPDYFTHIMFLDADMGFQPDLLGRLLRFDKDVIGAPGPTKYIHWDQLSDAMLNGKDPGSCTLRYAVNFLGGGKLSTEDGFAKVKDFGCCFTLVKTGAIQKMVEKYPDLRCDGMSWVNGGPTPHANNFAFFDTHVDEEGRYLECDHAFFARWRAIGGDVWADLTSNLVHVGTHNFKGNMSHYYFGRDHSRGTLNAEHTPWGDSWNKIKAPAPPYLSEIIDSVDQDRYHVTIIRPKGNNFPLCYKEHAKAIQAGLQDLGLDCTFRENRLEEDRINIVFGWHMWSKEHPLLTLRRYRIILYQGEQLAAGGRLMPDWYFRSMKEALAVWDYSQENIITLKPHGYAAQLVPPGWHERCAMIPRDVEQDIDVLFVGVLNLRREFMLKLLGSVCNCQALVDVWGEDRDSMIARSKIVLNIHYYSAATLELLRLGHLLANGVPVISEESDSNPYGDGIEMVPYRSLLPAVLQLLMDDKKREALGQRGRDAFERTPIVDCLSEALSALPKQYPAPSTS